MMRTLAALTVAAATTVIPLIAFAQTSPAPKPTNAIKNTQSGIKKAASKQNTAQAKSKKINKPVVTGVATGGGHSDSEAPTNPGANPSKPGAGPGYAGGTPK